MSTLKTFKVLDYRIISDRNPVKVQQDITGLIDMNVGWQPHGDLITNVVSMTTIIYTQAMVQYSEVLWPEE